MKHTKQDILNALVRVRREFSGPYGGGNPPKRIQNRLYDLRVIGEFVKNCPEELPPARLAPDKEKP